MICRLIAAAAAAALLPLAAPAQRLVSLGAGGGVSLPQGDLGDAVDLGWHGLASIVISSPMQPLGLRVDAAWNQFSFQDDVLPGNQAILSGTLNVTYRMPSAGWPAAPYLIAGLGAYHFRCTGDTDCGTTTRFGWNAGLGTRLNLMGLGTFLEARFQSSADAHFIPVTLGFIL